MEFPLKVVKRKNEKFVYVGDIPDTLAARKNARDFDRENGRKTVLVKDAIKSRKSLIHYVSAKFYQSLRKVTYPAYGVENLLRRGD